MNIKIVSVALVVSACSSGALVVGTNREPASSATSDAGAGTPVPIFGEAGLTPPAPQDGASSNQTGTGGGSASPIRTQSPTRPRTMPRASS
jgi:hypothetical protein